MALETRADTGSDCFIMNGYKNPQADVLKMRHEEFLSHAPIVLPPEIVKKGHITYNVQHLGCRRNRTDSNHPWRHLHLVHFLRD